MLQNEIFGDHSTLPNLLLLLLLPLLVLICCLDMSCHAYYARTPIAHHQALSISSNNHENAVTSAIDQRQWRKLLTSHCESVGLAVFIVSLNIHARTCDAEKHNMLSPLISNE